MRIDSLIESITPEVRKFILQHENSDTHKLALAPQKFGQISNSELANQIDSRKKAKLKLPTWYNCIEIIYPASVSLEQASSEAAAKWKRQNYGGNVCLDLTGGFGVDAFWFSQSFAEVISVENDPELVSLAIHNHTILGANNIVHVNNDAASFLESSKQEFDLIYLDPSRRKNGARVISINNYEPDVIALSEQLKNSSKTILIKTSPLQDISDAIVQLGTGWNAIILVVKNECKELIFEWNNENKGGEVRVFHLESEDDDFIFNYHEGKELKADNSPIKKYLYEPNAGIMKSAGFGSLGKKYQLSKLHDNTHLYTSNELIKFPGRVFEVIKVFPATRKHALIELPDAKANLTVRNFPDNVETLRKRLGLNSGGENYVFAFTDVENNPKLVHCRKLNSNKPEKDR